MDILYLSIIGFFLLTVIYLFNQSRKIKGNMRNKPELEYGNIIQKKTDILHFDTEGYLQNSPLQSDTNNIFLNYKPGQHISEFNNITDIFKYFETCKKFKKIMVLKLMKERDKQFAKRHDLIFSPVIKNNELTGITLVYQELVSKNNEEKHLTHQKELVEQRNYALRQIDEIEAQKSELELAFKKSSKHHIMLQKALRKIETQNDELEKALDIISVQKQKLEKANKEISESSRMKEIFLANTSHEIRTPLNAIIGFTNLLLDSKINSSQQKYLDNIKSSGNNLLVVINDILDFSKIESGKLTIEQIEFDFKNFIKYTLNTLSVKAQEKNISLKHDLSEDIPEIIIGDPVRLNQILINLLGNAIKFTDHNGYIRIYATLGQPVEDKIKILFKIEDNGIGIPKDKLNDIFQSFTQGESDTTRKFGGTGLGLSIVKQLIEIQGGEINVESEIGKGTSFTFFILLKEGEQKNEPHIKHQHTIKPKEKPNGIRILLVEDNAINQQLAYDTIKTWNNTIDIDVAQNGLIALNLVKKNNYHVILMDIQMPEMDGIEATQEIRKLDSQKKDTPIVAMTAHALKNEKENCIKIGMDDYLSKPFDPEDLFNKITYYAPKNSEYIASAIEDKTEDKVTNHNNVKLKEQTFNHFNLINLEKIYQKDISKIKKIVNMCFQSIPNEIMEINIAYEDTNWEVLRNKTHALKPKLGYLGMDTIQEASKSIEIYSQNKDQRDLIKKLIQDIEQHWSKALPEIEFFIENAS